MNIMNLPISQIKPYPNNPRNNAAAIDKVAQSIRAFGFKVPLVIDTDGTVVTGHTRLLAAQRLGMTEVPCVIADDLTPEQVKAFRIADNKVAEYATWDEERLAQEISELRLTDYDVEMTGFDDEEILDLIGEPDLDEDQFDPDEDARGVLHPLTQQGDIWHLGDHRLMCGDSTDADDVARLMGCERARIIITDPPYNVDYEGKAGKIINDNMSDDHFYRFLYDAFSRMYDVAEPGCPIYVFHADSEGLNFRQAYKDARFKLAECLVWVKNSLVLGRQDYQWRHEPILYGWKEGGPHHWYGHRDKTTVIDEAPIVDKMSKSEMAALLKQLLAGPENSTILYEDKPRTNDLHPTMKPLRLIGRLMSNSSRPGDNTLDLFGGSGSTMMAAEKPGRRAFTMEIDPVFCDVTVHRWEAYTGQRATREARP